jgi:hypothetical protein
MKNGKKRTSGIIFLAVLLVLLFGACGESKGTSAVNLDGVAYTKISPKEYASRLKDGKIGTGDKFVLEGLVLGTSENTLMLQEAGLTNIFTLQESADFSIGTRVRIFAELSLVNRVLIKASEAKVVKWEKL